MPATQAASVRLCIVCYFLLLDVHESFKQENIAVPPVAHLFTEVKVLYTSNTAYYVPGKNLGRSEKLQKASKMGKFLFSTLKCELSVIYSIQFVPRLKCFQMKKTVNGAPITIRGSRESLRMTSGVFLQYI